MKKILIIEDNAEVRENTAEIIELSNYVVITAADGKAGVEIALSGSSRPYYLRYYDACTGWLWCISFVKQTAETASIPFIFLTAKSEKTDFRKGMQMGADDYITKPFDGIELLNAIETRLNKNELLKQQYSGVDVNANFWRMLASQGKVQLTRQRKRSISVIAKNNWFIKKTNVHGQCIL